MEDKNFVIIIPSYNNEKWYEKNLLSACGQNYDQSRFRIIYTNDASTDRTWECVNEFVDKNNFKNIALINNNQRVGAICNIYNMIHSCGENEDNSILILLDGDDVFYHNNVLNNLNNIYINENVWMTYGNYIDLNHVDNFNHPEKMTVGCCRPFEENIIKNKLYRKVPWRCSHLHSWYVRLLKNIKKEDLFYQGTWASMSWDLLMNFPALEMCNGKFKFVKDINYIYNNTSMLNDFRINQQLQGQIDWFARQKPVYDSLEKLF